MAAAARQSFKEQEALVYQQLAQLIRDAVWLKSYIAAVMRLEQEAFQSAYASLGPSKATLPLQPEVPPQSEQMMMTTGSTINHPELQPQVHPCLVIDEIKCTWQLFSAFMHFAKLFSRVQRLCQQILGSFRNNYVCKT